MDIRKLWIDFLNYGSNDGSDSNYIFDKTKVNNIAKPTCSNIHIFHDRYNDEYIVLYTNSNISYKLYKQELLYYLSTITDDADLPIKLVDYIYAFKSVIFNIKNKRFIYYPVDALKDKYSDIIDNIL